MLTVGLAVFTGLIACRETRRAERDRRVLLEHVKEMERMIRNHDVSRIWFHVEGDHVSASKESSQDAVHQAMIHDFERLSHLRDFAMKDVQVEVTGDAALIRYRVEGAPPQPFGHRLSAESQPAPSAGELRFVRGAKGWEMAGHRFIEAR